VSKTKRISLEDIKVLDKMRKICWRIDVGYLLNRSLENMEWNNGITGRS